MIDKDIDRLKELQSTIYEGGDYIYLNKNDKQALGNVLTEFQGLRDFSTETVRRNAELQEELETYKKIAEFLAKKIVGVIQYDYIYENICINNPNYVFCENIGNHIKCKQCLLENARKEVEKDEP